jgi:hypothetical protein
VKHYDMPEALMGAIRGLCGEKRRLRVEALHLKAQHDALMGRFREGAVGEYKARALVSAIHDRLRLIRDELLPLVERRANELALEYLELIRDGGGRLPSFGMKMPARAARPYAGDELRN